MDEIFNVRRPLKRHLGTLLDRLKKEVSQLPDDILGKKNDDEICSELVQKFSLVAPKTPSLEEVKPTVDESVAKGPRKGIHYEVTYEIPLTQGEPSLLQYRPDPCQDVNGMLRGKMIVCFWEEGDAKAIREGYLSNCKSMKFDLESMGKQITKYNATLNDACSEALKSRRQRLDRKSQFRNELTGP